MGFGMLWAYIHTYIYSLKCVEALLISQGNESMCTDIVEYLRTYGHYDDPAVVEKRAIEVAAKLKQQEQEIRAHSDGRKQDKKKNKEEDAKEVKPTQVSALDSIQAASVLDLAGVTADEVKTEHDKVLGLVETEEKRKQQQKQEEEELAQGEAQQKSFVTFDPEAVKQKFIEEHQGESYIYVQTYIHFDICA